MNINAIATEYMPQMNIKAPVRVLMTTPLYIGKSIQASAHNSSITAITAVALRYLFTSVLPRVFILLLSINNMISPLVITVAK